MPTIALVLIGIGALGFLVSLVIHLFGSFDWAESPFVGPVLWSFMIGQAFINAGIIYWLIDLS